MRESVYVYIFEWLGRRPRWLRNSVGYILTWTSIEWWGYLFGKNRGQRSPYDVLPPWMSNTYMTRLPTRYSGKWYWERELCAVPEFIALPLAKVFIAWCRWRGHGHTTISGWDEPVYHCSRCGDEVG